MNNLKYVVLTRIGNCSTVQAICSNKKALRAELKELRKKLSTASPLIVQRRGF